MDVKAVDVCCNPQWWKRSCSVFWKYVARPCIVVLVTLGVGYLYVVPVTNLAGMQMFGDFKCHQPTGIWGACGNQNNHGDWDANGSDVGVGFFVFLLVQITVGFIILGVYLICSSRSYGRLRKFHLSDMCSACCYRDENFVLASGKETKRHRHELECGSCLVHCGIAFLVVGAVVSTLIVGMWGGRAIAVRSVDQCKPFINTTIGLYGCVSSATGKYVGADACTACIGVGFGILAVPLLAVEVVLLLSLCACSACRAAFHDTHQQMVQDKERQALLWLASANFEK